MDTVRRWAGLPERGQTVVIPRLPWPEDLAMPWMNFGGVRYPLTQTLTGSSEAIGADFAGLVQGAYKSNGIIFAALQARLMLLSQARFQWQRMRNGQPGDLWGNADLAVLENPEPGKVTADLLARVSVYADLGGTAFIVRRSTPDGLRLKTVRPDWVDMILGSNREPDLSRHDIDAELIGFVYYPGGRYSGLDPEVFLPDEMTYFAPIPDPLHRYYGMSWLTPIIGEIQSDTAATVHKLKFFENGATVNLVVTTGISDPAKFKEFMALLDEKHEGVRNAYKTLYLQEGGKAEAIGANMQQMEFNAMQSHSETRIAMASGIHPVILGASEGLQGSSLNQGNFMAARRLVADMTLRPWWGNFAASMEALIPPPPGSRLFYDDRHIPFLAEDVKDAAAIQQSYASTIKQLLDAGFQPDDAVKAVMAGDLRSLVGKHSGLFSVQLQPPGPQEPPPEPSVPVNGKAGNAKPAPEVIPNA
jgi:hypothetical protein